MNPAVVESRAAFITGATSGIGLALAGRLLDAGYRVALTGRDGDRLANLRQSLHVRADRLLTFVARPDDWPALSTAVDRAVDEFGRLDLAIPNAGFSSGRDLLRSGPELDREMVLVNLLGPALLVKAVAPHLIAGAGHVVFIGSIAGIKHLPGSLYGATKFGLSALAENTRMLLAPQGVTVTEIVPGYVDTPFHASGAPTGALTVDQVADAVLWAVGRPPSLEINSITVRPRGQAT